jgi:hypothetical protein
MFLSGCICVTQGCDVRIEQRSDCFQSGQYVNTFPGIVYLEISKTVLNTSLIPGVGLPGSMA